ncbi:hypothetical protein AUK22_10325, partial [bacterium CG2_30_54_10]
MIELFRRLTLSFAQRRSRPAGIVSLAIFGFVFLVFGEGIVLAAAWVLSGTRWSDRDEKAYQEFVQAVGESKHGNLNRFIKDPKTNPLYGEEDKKFSLSPDCADLPYQLRAYVAYKLRLPFGYVSDISSGGGDQRYSRRNRPASEKDHDSFDTPQRMFWALTLVNSGYYRMAPNVPDSDTYPIRIQRDSIKPGTIYYDPNGHVAVVFKITEDGRIRMIDAHPDKSLSRPWFGAKFALGTANSGGGFRRWRPQWYSSQGRVLRLDNHNIPDFSASDQYQRRFSFNGADGLSYFDYVRARLSNRGNSVRPLEDFRNMLEDVFEDVKYRGEAVNICIQAGISRKSHPGGLPSNIYGTDGEWEQYSTPSRDARLKVAFRDLFLRAIAWIRLAETRDPILEYSGGPQQLAQELIGIYDSMNQGLRIQYVNSAGKPVSLTFHDVVQRLFDLSFDPYHSIELRWGARDQELASAGDDRTKKNIYERERRLRNQLERLYNVSTGFSLGPEKPVNVDIRGWFAAYLTGQVRPEQELESPDSAPAIPAVTTVAAVPLQVRPPAAAAVIPATQQPNSIQITADSPASEAQTPVHAPVHAPATSPSSSSSSPSPSPSPSLSTSTSTSTSTSLSIAPAPAPAPAP